MINFIARLIRVFPPIGVLLMLVGVCLAISVKKFDVTSGLLTGVGVLLFLLVFVRGESANVKFYINVILASAAALAILVVLYLWIDLVDTNWDFTENQRHSLAGQSQDYLKHHQSK